jgi:hypothetical protein
VEEETPPATNAHSAVAAFLLVGVALLAMGGAALWRTAPEEPLAVPAQPAPPTSDPPPVAPPAKAEVVETTPSVDTSPTGTGKITGTVRDESGKPIAGARLRLADSSSWDPGKLRETWSDASGAFEFTDVAGGDFLFWVYARGFEIDAVEPTATRIRPGSVVDFVGHPTPAIPIRVLGVDGARMQDAIIERTFRGKSDLSDWSALDRRRGDSYVNIPASPTTLRAFAPDGASDAVAVDATTLAPGAVVELRLRERRGIRGRVVFPSNMSVPDSVTIRVDGRDAAGSIGSETHKAVATASSGFLYSVYDLSPGPHEITAIGGTGEGQVIASATVTVGDGMTDADLVVPSTSQDGGRPNATRTVDPSAFEIEVVGTPDGAPQLTVAVEPTDRSSPDHGRPVTGWIDPSGHARWSRRLPGTYAVTLWTIAHPPRTVAKTTVELQVDGQRVSIRVGDHAAALTIDAGTARKVRIASLRALDVEGEAEGELLGSERVGADGRVVFWWLRPGTYEVEIDGAKRRVDVTGATTLTW